MMAETMIPEPPPIPVPSGFAAIIVTTGASTTCAACASRAASATANAGARILEEATGAIAAECRWIDFVIGSIDDLETPLAIVFKGAAVHMDSVGANASDFRT